MGNLMKHCMIMGLFLMFLEIAFSQVPPNSKIYQKIEKLWIKGNSKGLKKLLAKRVKVDLQILPDRRPQKRYPRDKAAGILEWYFEKIEVMEFHYDLKRMGKSRGMAKYSYRIKETGEVYDRRLYFYLRKEKIDGKRGWFISAINEIGP